MRPPGIFMRYALTARRRGEREWRRRSWRWAVPRGIEGGEIAAEPFAGDGFVDALLHGLAIEYAAGGGGSAETCVYPS